MTATMSVEEKIALLITSNIEEPLRLDIIRKILPDRTPVVCKLVLRSLSLFPRVRTLGILPPG